MTEGIVTALIGVLIFIAGVLLGAYFKGKL